ncbi:DNA-protecting protein DprA [Oceanobacillus bengalensis]|uniref:DNA-protecting protein DprA n=1 Tax=Oceanobacillus bengalensis TaxID=1435466 RepID=A0A494Z4H3_9BACI|nr:DNA-processing protein DprA [Oceanobacillus bengalensis]RKQ17415.1 DNA-protecting protein DprA [Oceanobacillus bengalensis]
MKSIRNRLIHVSRCRGVTRKTIRKILLLDPALSNIYRLTPLEISKTYSIPHNNASLFHIDLHDLSLQEQLTKDLMMCEIITIVDDNYPRVLNTIKDSPLVLYAIGNISLLSIQPALSVIGTRKSSNEAFTKTKILVEPLVNDNWVIVSGMAKGIDSFAHITALNNNGKTIAVLGGGFSHIYPKQNIPLFNQIAKKGLVLSEYPPHTPPKRFHFPERNRIISGLSFGTLVIEATEKSGTLITVDQALDQGREVYAVPGSPLIPQTKGCHRMIQDGAKLVLDAQDIKEDWDTVRNNYISWV